MSQSSKPVSYKMIAYLMIIIIVISLTTVLVLFVDLDGDGLSNMKEYELKTNPNKSDTDEDGLKDGEEVLKYRTNPLKKDSDEDELSDLDEITLTSTDPLNKDTDGDGLTDGEEVLTYKTNPLSQDTDGDGLKDMDEVLRFGTQPDKPDTDGDGLKDKEELETYNTDPFNQDTDKDGLKDGDEVYKYGTNPKDPDTDRDGFSDGYDFWPLFDLKLNVTIANWTELNEGDVDSPGDPYFVIEIVYYPNFTQSSVKRSLKTSVFINLSVAENLTYVVIDLPDYFYLCFLYIYAYDNDTMDGESYDQMYYLNTTIYLGEVQRLPYLKIELTPRMNIESVIMLSNREKREGVDAVVEAIVSFIKSSS